MAFALWNTKGELLVASDLVGKTMAGAIEALPGMQLGPTKPAFVKEAALLMKPGARYRFEVPPALCWGAVAAGPELPANSVTIWEFTMKSIHDVPAFEPGDPAARQETPSGLQYEVLRAGTGAKPKATDTVEVHYTGWLADGGTLFDSSHGRGETIAFPLRGVIPGWTEGLQLMQEGAAYRFTIPAKLAYGPRGQPPTIPPNATLVFLVELIKVK
jgi:FKBP-type peptidyl-prolyl cis-trans isomerase